MCSNLWCVQKVAPSLQARMEDNSPELTFTSNPFWQLEFGVKVVVGASHLSDTYPMLSFKGKFQGSPAETWGKIHNEAHYIREGNYINIPEQRRKQQHTLSLSQQLRSSQFLRRFWLYLPALIPPHCFIAFGLKCCHDDIHIIVSISQHALLVWGHHGIGRQPGHETLLHKFIRKVFQIVLLKKLLIQ